MSDRAKARSLLKKKRKAAAALASAIVVEYTEGLLGIDIESCDDGKGVVISRVAKGGQSDGKVQKDMRLLRVGDIDVSDTPIKDIGNIIRDQQRPLKLCFAGAEDQRSKYRVTCGSQKCRVEQKIKTDRLHEIVRTLVDVEGHKSDIGRITKLHVYTCALFLAKKQKSDQIIQELINIREDKKAGGSDGEDPDKLSRKQQKEMLTKLQAVVTESEEKLTISNVLDAAVKFLEKTFKKKLEAARTKSMRVEAEGAMVDGQSKMNFKTVIYYMRCYRDSAEMQLKGCQCLSWMTSPTQNDSRRHRFNCQREGGIEAVVDAMTQHSHNAEYRMLRDA
jgi:hypothetical protein